MRSKQFERIAHSLPAGKPVAGQWESKSKAEEKLIEEILAAAGLEPLN